MSKISLMIWNREFDLEVKYYNFPDQEVSDNQRKTAENIRNVDFNQVLNEVKEYIKNNNNNMLAEKDIINVFKYIMPKKFLVFRSENIRVFSIICDYKFDMEHGIAIMFENEKFTFIGSTDEVL